MKNIQNTKIFGRNFKFVRKIQDNNFNSVLIKDAVWNFATEKGRGNVLLNEICFIRN